MAFGCCQNSTLSLAYAKMAHGPCKIHPANMTFTLMTNALMTFMTISLLTYLAKDFYSVDKSHNDNIPTGTCP